MTGPADRASVGGVEVGSQLTRPGRRRCDDQGVSVTDLSLPPFGRLAWIDVVLLGWFVLSLVSVAYGPTTPQRGTAR